MSERATSRDKLADSNNRLAAAMEHLAAALGSGGALVDASNGHFPTVTVTINVNTEGASVEVEEDAEAYRSNLRRVNRRIFERTR